MERPENDSESGSPLRDLADTYRLLQDTRKTLDQRGSPYADALLNLEKLANRAIKKEFKKHLIYDWLPKGLRGATVARIVATIGDPRRFPGQPCSEGHISPAVYEVGESCPAVSRLEIEHEGGPGGASETQGVIERRSGGSRPESAEGCAVSETRHGCPGVMLPPRRGSGVRSLWHYCGLNVVDGKLNHKRKGAQADFSPRLKSLLLMPDLGVRAQIIRHRTPKYREAYDDAKVRLLERGLPPYRANQIAGVIAVKRFLGDLLVEWKRRLKNDAGVYVHGGATLLEAWVR